jgi:hypothetical protein
MGKYSFDSLGSDKEPGEVIFGVAPANRRETFLPQQRTVDFFNVMFFMFIPY